MEADLKHLSLSMGSDGSAFGDEEDEIRDIVPIKPMSMVPTIVSNDIDSTVAASVNNLTTTLDTLCTQINVIGTVVNEIASSIDGDTSGKQVEGFAALITAHTNMIKEARAVVKDQPTMVMNLMKEKNKTLLAMKKMDGGDNKPTVGGGISMTAKQLAEFARNVRTNSELNSIEAVFEEVRR